MTRKVSETEGRCAEAQKTNAFDKKIGVCAKDQECWPQGENGFLCRDGPKWANMKYSEPGVWDGEEKHQLGSDVQVTSGYTESTEKCDVQDFELTRLTQEDMNI